MRDQITHFNLSFVKYVHKKVMKQTGSFVKCLQKKVLKQTVCYTIKILRNIARM